MFKQLLPILIRSAQFCDIKIHVKPVVNLQCRLLSNSLQSDFKRGSFLENEHAQKQEQNTDQQAEPMTKLLKVAIIGAPNCGKSTLINQLIGRRVFASSSKIHTTKCRARAVYNEGNTQVIFLDTPGLVSAAETKKYKLESSFISDGEESLLEADVIGVLHDVSALHFREKLDVKVLRLLYLYPNKHYILILNKTDLVKSKQRLLDLIKNLTNDTLNKKFENTEEEDFRPLSEIDVLKKTKQNSGWSNFKEVFMISALMGSGVGDVKEYLLQFSKPHKWLFPDDVYTDIDPYRIIEESVRSRLLDNLPKEIPYGLETILEYYEKTPEDTIVAVVLVRCEKQRIEKLVMGAGGSRIKVIARQAEQELANTFLTVVKLKIVVTSKESKETDVF